MARLPRHSPDKKIASVATVSVNKRFKETTAAGEHGGYRSEIALASMMSRYFAGSHARDYYLHLHFDFISVRIYVS